MTQPNFPRVLLVAADPIGSPTGTGLTLASMFALWPKDSLAQVHTVPLGQDADIPMCQLGDETVLGLRTIRRLIDGNHVTETQSVRGSLPASNALDRATWKRAWVDQLPLRPTPALGEFVTAYEPDIIYTPLGFTRVMALLRRVRMQRDVPVVPHFMDDWMASLLPSPANAIPRHRIRSTVNKTVRRSPHGLAISDLMAAEYSLRWNIPFSRIGNAVDVQPWQEFTGPPAFGYVGGMHLQRWHALVDIATAIEHGPAEVTFEIVTPKLDVHRWGRAFSSFKKTRLLPAIAPDQIVAKLRTFRALVHVESGDAIARKYTRLSLSTKIPQYLAAGRPVVAYGPQEVASMQHLRRSGAALHVETGAEGDLSDAIRLLTNDSECLSRGRAGHAFAVREHTIAAQTETLQRVFAEASAAR